MLGLGEERVAPEMHPRPFGERGALVCVAESAAQRPGIDGDPDGPEGGYQVLRGHSSAARRSGRHVNTMRVVVVQRLARRCAQSVRYQIRLPPYLDLGCMALGHASHACRSELCPRATSGCRLRWRWADGLLLGVRAVF